MWLTLHYAPTSPNLPPLRRLIAHMGRTRKWPPCALHPLRCLTCVRIRRKGGLRERDGPKPRRRGTPKPARRRALCRSGAGARKHVRLPPPDLWRPHRPSYNRYMRGRETAASQQGRHAHDAQARSPAFWDQASKSADLRVRGKAERQRRTAPHFPNRRWQGEDRAPRPAEAYRLRQDACGAR